MRPKEREREFSELVRKWNRRLFEEGLGVFRGGREVPLPPEEIERLRPITGPKGRKHPPISIPFEVLSPREREVVGLLFFEGLSEREAARRIGISRSSVRSYRKEALRKLRERMRFSGSTKPVE